MDQTHLTISVRTEDLENVVVLSVQPLQSRILNFGKVAIDDSAKSFHGLYGWLSPKKQGYFEDKGVDVEGLHMECLTGEKGNVKVAWMG